MTNTIRNTDDTIDSRDVIARIEKLTEERVELENAIEGALDGSTTDAEREVLKQALADWLDSEEGLELAALEKLAEEAEGYAADWKYGKQLIRDSYFEEAMDEDEMIANCDDFGKDLPFWATITLDYSALQQDYSAVDFDGVTYWVR